MWPATADLQLSTRPDELLQAHAIVESTLSVDPLHPGRLEMRLTDLASGS
jgi:hypothetical protein